MVTLYAPKDLNLHIAIAYIEAGEEQEIPETAISLGKCGCNEYTVEGTLTNEKGEALFKIIQCNKCFNNYERSRIGGDIFWKARRTLLNNLHNSLADKNPIGLSAARFTYTFITPGTDHRLYQLIYNYYLDRVSEAQYQIERT